ncbi:hypothetical protein MNBD_ALPHA06-1435 [hydrothermal vent metagenome]|uniref:Uncharacterized protein n=1 Tax=hydrothermal vent metagenome TaxID=652676 RepID=A0A3B0REJ9_9ZZZZ
MNISFTFKYLIIATAVVAMVVVVFLVHALAGLSARPVVFAAPPAFVERYVAENHSDPSSPPKEPETDGGQVDSSDSVKMTTNFSKETDFSKEEALVFKVIMDGTLLDELLQLFAHPQKAQRVKIAWAFASVNSKFTHDEESGFPEKRRQFWVDVEEHLPDIQNALFEAVIASAEEGTTNKIPYTLAWMPGQDHETIELLAWAANHHPAPWVRRFSVFFVVEHGRNEELAAPLLRNRTHDPDYRVRKEVLDQRFRRFTQMLRTAEEA